MVNCLATFDGQRSMARLGNELKGDLKLYILGVE